MDVKQIIPVSIAPDSSLYHTRVASLDREILAYPTDTSVVILSSDLGVLQILSCESDEKATISCLAWNRTSGELAVCVGKEVFFWSLNQAKVPSVWELQHQITHSFPVVCADWSTTGQYFVVGGSSFVIWDLNPSVLPLAAPVTGKSKALVPKIPPKPASPILDQLLEPVTCVKISPDTRLVLTFSAEDTLPKVWYRRRKKQNPFGFVYLPHPTPVLFASWRNQPLTSGAVDRNVLLTCSADGELRVWVESDQRQRLKFTIFLTAPIGNLSTADWLSFYYDKASSERKTDSLGVPSDFHTVSEMTKFRHVDVRKYIGKSNENVEDWIVAMDQTGSISVYKIKDLPFNSATITKHSHWDHALTSSPRIAKTPGRVSLVGIIVRFQTPNSTIEFGSIAMHPGFISLYFVDNVTGSIQFWNVSLGGEKIVSEITVDTPFESSSETSEEEVEQAPTPSPYSSPAPKKTGFSAITFESTIPKPKPATKKLQPTKVRSFLQPPGTPTPAKAAGESSAFPKPSQTFGSALPTSQAKLVLRSQGHSKPILKLCRHSSLPVVATTDGFSVIIWMVQETSLVDPTRLLLDICFIEQQKTEQFKSIVWDLTDSILYVLTTNTTTQREFVSAFDIHLPPQSSNNMTVAPIALTQNRPFEAMDLDDIAPVLPFYVTKKGEFNNFEANVSILLVISKPSGGREVNILKITKTVESSSIKTQSIGRYFLPDGCCFATHTPMNLKDGLNGIGVNPFHLITGSPKGQVATLRLTREQSKEEEEDDAYASWEVNEFCKFDIGANYSITSVSPVSFSRMSLFVSTAHIEEIQIWEFEKQVSEKFCLETTFTVSMSKSKISSNRIGLSSPLLSIKYSEQQHEKEAKKEGQNITLGGRKLKICGEEGPLRMDWVRSSYGGEILAISRGRFVCLLSQREGGDMKNIHDFEFEWFEADFVSLTGPNPLIENLAWLPNGGFVVTQESSIYVYSKWHRKNDEIESILHSIPASHAVLPEYHPKILIEYLMAGWFTRVSTILKSLHKELRAVHENKSHKMIQLPLSEWIMKETPVETAASASTTAATPTKSTETAKKVEDEDDGSFVFRPRMTFADLMKEDTPESSSSSSSSSSESEEESDEYEYLPDGSVRKIEKKKKKPKQKELKSPTNEPEDPSILESESFSKADKFESSDSLTPEQANELAGLMSIVTVPGINRKEQLQLKAVVEALGHEVLGLTDKCAVKYKLMNQIFLSEHLSRRAVRMAWSQMAWALHSESHPTLVEQIMAIPSVDYNWKSVKAFGFPIWVSDHPTIVKLTENIAKTAYLESKKDPSRNGVSDPCSCAIYYIALGRTGALATLFSASSAPGDAKIGDFLKRDFGDSKVRLSAEKNAYTLMTTHRFEMAVAFFLLAGNHRRAIIICIEKLNDFQLALLIARLLEGHQEGPLTKDILENFVLPTAIKQQENELASIALWLLKRYQEAAEILAQFSPIMAQTEFAKPKAEPKPSSSRSGRFSFLDDDDEPPQKSAGKPGYLSSSGSQSERAISASEENLKYIGHGAMLPSSIYFFNFLLGTQIIKNRKIVFSQDILQNLRKKAIYLYFHLGCAGLCFEQMALQATGECTNFSTPIVKEIACSVQKDIQDQCLLQYFTHKLSQLQKITSDLDTEESFIIQAMTSLQADFNFLCELFPAVDADKLQSRLLEYCYFEGYERVHFLLLTWDKRYKEAAFLLRKTAENIASIAFNFLVAGETQQAQIKHFEVSVRNLDASLKEYSNPLQKATNSLPTGPVTSWTVDEVYTWMETIIDPAEAEKIRRHAIDGPQLLLFDLQHILDHGVATGPAQALEVAIREVKKKGKLDVEPLSQDHEINLTTDHQIMVLASCLVGMFCCAWTVRDYVTLFELINSPQIDQLTKSRVCSFEQDRQLWDHWTAKLEEQDRKKHQDDEDSEPEEQATPQSKQNDLGLSLTEELLREHRQQAAMKDQRIKDDQDAKFTLSNRSRSYLEDLMRLMILKKFSETLNQYLSINLTEAAWNTKFTQGLMVARQKLETEMAIVPIQILNLSQDEDFLTMNSVLGGTSVDFFIMLIKREKLFGDPPNQKIQIKKHLPNVFELSNYLLDEPSIREYLSEVYFIQQNNHLKNLEHEMTQRILSNSKATPKGYTTEEGYEFFERVSAAQTRVIDKKRPFDEEDEDVNQPGPAEDDDHEHKITFGPSKVVFHESNNEVIYAFTMNPVSKTQVAIASGSGLQEIDFATIEETKSPNLSRSGMQKKRKPLTEPSSPSKGLFNSTDSFQNDPVWTLQSHPKLPFYFSGGSSGSLLLWQWGVPEAVERYQSVQVRINKIGFNATGSKFAACGDDGQVSVWRFSKADDSTVPYRTMKCYSARATDIAFLNSGSYFATSGYCVADEDKKSIRFWDTLLPNLKANVWSCSTPFDGEASCMVYSPSQSMIYCGHKRGGLAAIDLRQRAIVTVIEKAHESNLRTMALDPLHENVLITGGTEGSVKIWDVSRGEINLIEKRDDVYKQTTFVRGISAGTDGFNSAVNIVGVVQIKTTPPQGNKHFFYVCGSDGNLLRRPIYYR